MKTSPSPIGLFFSIPALVITGSLAFIAPKAQAQLYNGYVSSSNATINYGDSFTPSYSGGQSVNGYQFYVSGYTYWDAASTTFTGTSTNSNPDSYPSSWYSSWTPPTAGTYSFYVAQDGDDNYDSSNIAGPYTLTVSKASQAGISSSNATITYGQSFTPSYSGGSGTGGWQFCIADYTNWDGGVTSYTGTSSSGTPDSDPGSWSSSWTPSAPGTYTFWVARDEDGNYNSSAISSSYTLTVTKANQSAVSSSNATIAFDGSTQSYPAFTPSYSGGSGTGGWQFCVAYYTNWDGGVTTYTGTSSSGMPDSDPSSWSSSWTPSAPGTYTFWVARDEDTDYNSSGASSAYTLTVTGPVDALTWNSIGLPSSGTVNNSITFTANVTNAGTSYWNGNYYLGVEDSGGTDLNNTSISGISPGGSITPTFSLTLPATAGTYTYTFFAFQNGVDYFGTNQTASIVVYPTSNITSASTASGTYGTAFSYTITAAGSPTSFGASGLPGWLSINTSTGVISGTPTATGNWSITITASNGGGTQTANLNLTISPEPTTFSASPLLFLYNGSAQSPTITATPGGATYTSSGGTETSAGNYTLTVTATGNYSGSSTISWTITPVGTPTGLFATSEDLADISFSWSPATELTGAATVTGYDIYRDGSLLGSPVTFPTFTDTGLAADTSYTYYVIAIDSLGNLSAASASLTLSTIPSTGSSGALSVLGLGSSPTVDTSNTLQLQVLQPQ